MTQKTKDKKPKKAQAVPAKPLDAFDAKVLDLAAVMEKLYPGPWTHGSLGASTELHVFAGPITGELLIATCDHDNAEESSYAKAFDLAQFMVLAREVLPRLLAERKGS